MSKTLLLVRHAKAEFDSPYGDHERCLTGKGEHAAKKLGKRVSAYVERVDLALVSSAQRTQQTYALMSERLTVAQARVDEAIYFAGVGDILDIVRELPEEAQCVILVGHEPTISGAGRALAEPCPAAAAIAFGVPTGTALLLSAEGTWADFAGAQLTVIEHGA
ncbi:SixA phosphatase family protein [Buchananella felis]|uniref:SixA phosphatase family protein n=1 Tax=Buchananella felis TaxID=3231492 RepID=UPI0035285211